MAKKLLLVVDVQRDFVEGGALPYGYPTESVTQKVIDFAQAWATDKDHAGQHLMFATQDTHGNNYHDTLEGKNLPVAHCVKDTYGWQFADYAGEDTSQIGWLSDEVFLKPTFGTFKVREAIEQYEKDECEEIDEIQIVGFDLAICVLANAVILRAAFPNKRIVVLKDLCGCVNKETFDAAVKVLQCQQIEVA